jgi:hypothetical protein
MEEPKQEVAPLIEHAVRGMLTEVKDLRAGMSTLPSSVSMPLIVSLNRLDYFGKELMRLTTANPNLGHAPAAKKPSLWERLKKLVTKQPTQETSLPTKETIKAEELLKIDYPSRSQRRREIADELSVPWQGGRYLDLQSLQAVSGMSSGTLYQKTYPPSTQYDPTYPKRTLAAIDHHTPKVYFEVEEVLTWLDKIDDGELNPEIRITAREVDERMDVEGGKETFAAEYQIWRQLLVSGMNGRSFFTPHTEGPGMEPSWMRSFKAFLTDVGRKPPGQGAYLTRKNLQKGFVKGNVEWVTTMFGSTQQRRFGPNPMHPHQTTPNFNPAPGLGTGYGYPDGGRWGATKTTDSDVK